MYQSHFPILLIVREMGELRGFGLTPLYAEYPIVRFINPKTRDETELHFLQINFNACSHQFNLLH
jgi:hypothetical protein